MIRKRIVQVLGILTLFFAPLLQMGVAHAAVDTCTWTGSGADNNWSTGANWSCSTDGTSAPGNGDSLVFPDGASRLSNMNDLVGLTINTISINGNGYTLAGNAITITPTSSTGMYFNANTTDFSIPVTLSAGTSKAIYNGGTANEFNSDLVISLVGQTMNINTSSGSDIVFNGVISGNMTTFVLNDNDGTVTFAATNTFTTSGYLAMFNDADVVCAASGCLGNTTNLLYYFGSSSLSIDTSAVLANDIIVDSASTTPSMHFVGGGANYDGDLTVNQTLSVTVLVSVTDAEFNGNIAIASGKNLNISGTGNYATSSITLSNGAISGTGDVAFDGVGAMMLGNNTTFDGDIYVNENALLTTYQPSLGTATGQTFVAEGGVLRTSNGSAQTISEPLTLTGTGHASGSYAGGAFINEGNSVEFTGTITVVTNATIMSGNNLSGTPITLSGQISGAGDLTLAKDHADAGDFVMSGTATNDFTGYLILEGSTLTLQKSGGVGIPGNVYVLANSIDDAMLIIENTAGNQLADNAEINLVEDPATDAILGSRKPTEVVGSVTGNGNFYVTAVGQGITVGGGDVSGEFTGTFTNTTPSTITKVGSGIWDISGASYGGVAGQGPTIDVQDGEVIWGGALSEINTVISDNGTLKGTGDAGSVTVEEGGVINVGNSPGCMTVATLTLNDGATFTEEIAGTTACSEYDETTVLGAVDLGNATLDVQLSETPAVGDVYTIIEADTLSGTFDGLTDGAIVGVGGVEFRINYTATAVTLTVTNIDALTSVAAGTGVLANTGTVVIRSMGFGLTLLILAFLASRTKVKSFNEQ